MLSSVDFVRQSLNLHLFFGRIMKEHSFFLQAGFTPRDASFARQADDFRRAFDAFLGEVISVSNGVVDPAVLQSGEVITPFTLKAEMATTFLTGVQIPTQLTRAEAALFGGSPMAVSPALEQKVFLLNQKAINLLNGLILFKTEILSKVLSCKMFTFNYPLLIDHILREARLYRQMVQRLQRREKFNLEKEIFDLELFWNRIMAEHAKFIRGLLDPTENALFERADELGKEFDRLIKEVKAAMDKTAPPAKLTDKILEATKDIRDFKAQGTQGLLECKIRSIIVPLLGDHVLREANHYLRLLKMFKKL